MAHILVADDEEALRVFLARALSLRGHKVATAEDGAEALALLGKERFDLLLSDIMMPVMDGITLALNASRDHPSLPIIMMTGYVAEKERAEALDDLVHTIVSKPFSMDDICAQVEEALCATV